MKERPILFSAPMVLAILEGRKTQTRRILKMSQQYEGYIEGLGKPEFCENTGEFTWFDSGTPIVSTKCKHGVHGDRLWVKETFAICEADGPKWFYRADSDDDGTIPYLVSGAGGSSGGVGSMKVDRWKPSIFMPRHASRITLEIEAVRVERLIEITAEDCIAEGVYSDCCGWYANDRDLSNAWTEPEGAYRELWESINGPGSWDLNPYVWVIQFRRVK